MRGGVWWAYVLHPCNVHQTFLYHVVLSALTISKSVQFNQCAWWSNNFPFNETSIVTLRLPMDSTRQLIGL